MRIGFPRNVIGQPRHAARLERGTPVGEVRHREIKAAPEEMDWAALPQEAAAEEFEETINLEEGTPEAMHCGGVISGVGPVLREADRIRDLGRARSWRRSVTLESKQRVQRVRSANNVAASPNGSHVAGRTDTG